MIRKVLMAAVLCCACKDSVIPVATVRGTYALNTIDGATLPFTVTSSSGKVTVIVADSITLMESGVFHEAGTQRVTVGGVTTTGPIFNYGTYGFLSTSMTLHSDLDGINRTGQLEGDTMTVLDSGHIQVFKKLN